MNRLCRVSFAAAALLAARAATAQPHETRPAYEAASIHLNNSGDGHHGTDGYQGRIFFENQPLHRLIEIAYAVTPGQVRGPDWLNTVNFDITATYPPDSKPAERALMLRTLLEDRFQLTVHRETREVPGYALVVAKGGFKLKPAEPGENSTNHSGGAVQYLKAGRTTMHTLAELLSRYIGQVVADQTGTEGVYDFELRWTRDETGGEPARADAPPPIYTALQETLGLRLQPQKVQADFIVVDRVERLPSEN